MFAGEVLRYEAMVEDELYVSRAQSDDPKVPSYAGGKFPLSTYLAARVRNILADPAQWKALPQPVREWLEIQEWRSVLPGPRELLVETFPRGDKHYLVCYPFEGRLAHQTLGMLLTRRLERARLRPLGFVANEYALAVWRLGDVAQRVDAGQAVACGTVRRGHAGRRPGSVACGICAHEAHLPQQCDHRGPDRSAARTGAEKTRRQVTISTDLIYDVLRKHQPDHLLLRAARADAATGLLDIKRLGEMLSRIRGRIIHKRLEHVSPLAVPVMLEIGRETVYGEASDALLAETADELVKEAMS